MFSGITQFCYTRTMPEDAVGIASLSATAATPDDLVSINNNTYLPASLNIWRNSTPDSSPADFTCPDYNQITTISGSTQYRIDNQFFELTNISNNGVVYWYVHTLPAYASGTAAILNLDGTSTMGSYYIISGSVYHNFYETAMLIQYSDTNGYIHTDLLNAGKVFNQNPYQAGNTTYLLLGRQLNLASTGNYYIRFMQPAGFMVIPPWNDQANMPWYVNIRYPLNPFPVEWANQIFSPQAPYIAASLVPGVVLNSSIMEFERKDIYQGPNFPDILVYNADYSIKYALDGSPQGSPKKKGNIYPWKRGLISSIDPHTARISVSVDLDVTDIVFAFYQYQELDIIYRDIDVNPFTNLIVKDAYIDFYVKTSGVNGLNSIYYKVINPSTGSTLLTNDTNPSGGSPIIFSTVSVGSTVSTSSILVNDIRVRGGGLLLPYQSEAESVSCWDIGFWDGKPYPVSGGLMVYLPVSLLDTFDRDSILTLIQETLPAGAFPVIKYYDNDGTETT